MQQQQCVCLLIYQPMLQHYRYKIPEVDDAGKTKGLSYKSLTHISEVQDLGVYMGPGQRAREKSKHVS